MAVSVVDEGSPPAWKRGELGDIKAALVEIQDLDTRLHERALRAYERYNIPAPIVVWAAQRAWAQGTPHLFAVILMNHIEDCYRRLPSIVRDSMIL